MKPAMPGRAGIACAGDWIVDYVHGIARWPDVGDLVRIDWQSVGVGGGAANVASDLTALGAPFPVAGLGCIGDDDAGRIVQAHCRRVGLDTAKLTVLDGVATGQTHVMALAGGNRTFFYNGGANDVFDLTHVDVPALAASGYRMFYLGYLALLGQLDAGLPDGGTRASRLLQSAQAAGLLTCVDVVSEEAGRLARIVAPALAHTDYLIINEIEAERVSGIPVRDASGTLRAGQLEKACAALIDAGVRRAVVVHAPERGLWFDRHQGATWEDAVAVDPARIVSTVGAGDAFCAAVLYGIHEGWPARTSLHRAHRVAAACLAGLTATDGIPAMSTVAIGDAGPLAKS